jgi:hypothetical protein
MQDPYGAAVKQALLAKGRQPVLVHVPVLEDLGAATLADRQALLIAQLEQLLLDARPLASSASTASTDPQPRRRWQRPVPRMRLVFGLSWSVRPVRCRIVRDQDIYEMPAAIPDRNGSTASTSSDSARRLPHDKPRQGVGKTLIARNSDRLDCTATAPGLRRSYCIEHPLQKYEDSSQFTAASWLEGDELLARR